MYSKVLVANIISPDINFNVTSPKEFEGDLQTIESAEMRDAGTALVPKRHIRFDMNFKFPNVIVTSVPP
jgi:hypothetical protein